MDDVGFVSLQDLDGLRGLGVDDEDAGVAALRDEALPAPVGEGERETLLSKASYS